MLAQKLKLYLNNIRSRHGNESAKVKNLNILSAGLYISYQVFINVLDKNLCPIQINPHTKERLVLNVSTAVLVKTQE